IADAAQLVEPFPELSLPLAVRLMQPIRVVRQIERARAARDRAPMPHRVQELAFLERVHELRTGLGELGLERRELPDQLVEASRIDTRSFPVTLEQLRLPLELLDDLRADIAAIQNREHLEQARDRGARSVLRRLLRVVRSLLEQELDAEKRAHPLGERLLESDDRGVAGGIRQVVRGIYHNALFCAPRIVTANR